MHVTAVYKGKLPGASVVRRIPNTLRYLEDDVLTSCEPYVPYRTGRLSDSAVATGEGDVGEIRWTAPYAAACYYSTRQFGKKVHPVACGRWFEAAKAVSLPRWIRTAARHLTEDTMPAARDLLRYDDVVHFT